MFDSERVGGGCSPGGTSESPVGTNLTKRLTVGHIACSGAIMNRGKEN